VYPPVHPPVHPPVYPPVHPPAYLPDEIPTLHYSTKDIIKIDPYVDDSFIYSVIKKDTEIKKAITELGLTDAQAKDYVKYVIMTKIDISDIINLFQEEQMEFEPSILEYLTNKKSLEMLKPDNVVYPTKPRENVPVTVVPLEISIIGDKETEVVKIENLTSAVILHPKVIFPKIKAPLDVIRKHLSYLEELHRLNSIEYLESINLDIILNGAGSGKPSNIDMTLFKETVLENLQLHIDTSMFSAEESVTMSVKVGTDEYFANVPEHLDGVLVVTISINEGKIKKLEDQLKNIEDLETAIDDPEVMAKIKKFLETITGLKNTKILEIPIDTFIYRDDETGVITVEIK
jgi:hypothetical protein